MLMTTPPLVLLEKNGALGGCINEQRRADRAISCLDRVGLFLRCIIWEA